MSRSPAGSPGVVPLRPPGQVMRLERMGSRFQTRLSFMRSVLRRLGTEGWTIEQTRCDWDDHGFGTAVYAARGPHHTYSLIAYSAHLDPADRSDRVIAERWDAAFALFDGEPTNDDIARLAVNVPLQEAGRCSSRELTLSRANKSVRLFEEVVDSLAAGRQPDRWLVDRIGYLMRTTAVYGNGKFGLADRDRICRRPELAEPYQAELLTVYLIRCFTHDLVEHVARRRNPDSFVPLDRAIRRHLGVGNATGLGMAPFLHNHPILLNNWVMALETALASCRSVERIDVVDGERFVELVAAARRSCRQWHVDDERQMTRIVELRADLARLERELTTGDLLGADVVRPWDRLYRWAEEHLSTEGQEMVVSLIIDVHPELVDHLASSMGTVERPGVDPAMAVAELAELLDRHYGWALDIDFDDPDANHFFWYTSEEKLEPRLGERQAEPGADLEHPLAVARDVCRLRSALAVAAADTPAGAADAPAGGDADGGRRATVAEFLLAQPGYRHIVRRVQTLARHPYGEIRDNLIGRELLAIDMLRFKLSVFGATKFDPKSDKWTRITLYQGAPLPDELEAPDGDRWMLLPHLDEACAP